MTSETAIKALVVDDEVIPNSLVQLQLEQLGYTVIGNAYDGPEAVRLTQELRPDVVVMDLRMMDPATGKDDHTAGLKAAAAIQQVCPTPVVVVTAYESPELVQQASSIGVGAYLVKPTRERDLERAITIALARFRDFMELQRLHTELELYNAELDAFAGTVAQGLKAPLKKIIAYIETLLREPQADSDRTVAEQMRVINRESYTILNISKELLLRARLRQTGNIEVQPLDMAEIVKSALRRLQGLRDWQEIEVSLPGSWPTAEGYEPWVEEIWVSLLSNAVSHGLPEQPPFRIEIGAETLPQNMIRFWVRDFGPGVPEERQRQLFTPLTPLSMAQGTGVGLDLVQYLVERMGGVVGVISPVPASDPTAACGSLFFFTLPESANAYPPYRNNV